MTIASDGFKEILRREVEEIREAEFVVIKAGVYPPANGIENVLEILNIGAIAQNGTFANARVTVEASSRPVNRRARAVRRRRDTI